MEILIKHYGNSRTSPSKIIELNFKDGSTQFTIDVTNINGLVDITLIENLRDIADELEEQNRKIKHTIPRYFVDIRGGCGAIRDKWHESYDDTSPGLHSDTLDVVKYRHGIYTNDAWNMKDEDVKYLNDLCDSLNNGDK